MLTFVGFLILSMAPQIVTGYLEYRYYSAIFWAALLAFTVRHITRARTLCQARVFAALYAGIIGALIAAFVCVQCISAWGAAQTFEDKWQAFDSADDVAELARCVGEDRGERILVVSDDEFAAKAGALYSLRTMMEPRNMAQGRLNTGEKAAFMESWDVQFVLVLNEQRSPREWPRFSPIEGCGLPVLKRIR